MSSSTPTNLPHAHLFYIRRFCQIIAKKNSKSILDNFLTAHYFYLIEVLLQTL